MTLIFFEPEHIRIWAKGRKECRGKWRNGSAEREGTRLATTCKTRDQQGPKIVASLSEYQAGIEDAGRM